MENKNKLHIKNPYIFSEVMLKSADYRIFGVSYLAIYLELKLLFSKNLFYQFIIVTIKYQRWILDKTWS